MSFNDCSHVVITGENSFNHVHGDQTIINMNKQEVKRTEYDEFEYIKRGHVISVQELGYVKNWDWDWRTRELVERHKKTICTVEIVDRQSRYTAMIYKGKDAQDFWEEDFRQFSRNKKPGSFQLFGINQSEIPALIFHHELIPFAQFFNRKSIWMEIYIKHLKKNMECSEDKLWMDTSGGVLFSGPDGPFVTVSWSLTYESIVVPTTVDMLKDDTCSRFFINFGSSVDSTVLACVRMNSKSTYLDNLPRAIAEDHQSKDSDHPNWSLATHPYLQYLWLDPPDHLPINVGRIRFDTVYSPSMEAVARWPPEARSLWTWKEYRRKGLVEGTVLDNGLTRFKLDLTQGEEVHLLAEYDWWWLYEGWLSQSSRVFDAIGVTEGKEDFFIVDAPQLEIQSTRRLTASCTLCNHEHVEETPPTPIYLFFNPFPMSVSELVSWMEGRPYFWSFDETGQSRMSEEECERWGLPVLTLTRRWKYSSVRLHSWPTHVYIALRDWQQARGFDPATSAWAQSRGCPELEIVGARKVQAGSPWWEAVVGSGISAFAI